MDLRELELPDNQFDVASRFLAVCLADARIVAAFVLSALLAWGMTYAQTYLTGWIGQHLLQDLRRQIFGHLQKQPVGFYERRPAGVLISRMTNDIEALDALVNLSAHGQEFMEIYHNEGFRMGEWEHAACVGALTFLFGKYLNMEDGMNRLLAGAALLHDAGKLSMPADIRNTPSFLLEEEARQVYNEHPQLGAERIIARSRHKGRQKLALEFGATDIVTERGDKGVVKIKELTGGLGAHSVVEAVGTHLGERMSWDQGTLLHEPVLEGAARHVWSRTDLTPADIDVVELYDGFTFNCLSWLEMLGFCGIGEGGPFVEGGSRIALDGALPLNTHGGQLSAGRLHGWGFLHEACVQLRGEGGDRQVPKRPEVVLFSAGGGHPGGVMILTRPR